ncbi:MAG: TetR family transcriptional regulator [Sphingomonas bacterium]|nr:TetR family transcriptional regulator [Sphingomonas bacterium]
MKLDRPQIVATALALLDEDGIDAFSLRKLAPRLSVQAPALYWHVGGKAELLGLMAAAIHAEARGGIAPGIGWREWLLDFGRRLRAAMLRRRDGARLCASGHPGQADAASSAEAIAAPLVAAGLDRAHALSFQGAVIALALGWSLYEQSGPMHDLLSTMFSFDAAFETSLLAMVQGFPDVSVGTTPA